MINYKHLGIASFSNPFIPINSDTYYAFYGSAKNSTPEGFVGLVMSESKSLNGPWIRLPNNPIPIINNPNNTGYTEQPIIYQFNINGIKSFGAFFDALNHESEGNIGYNWSQDGINWNKNCYQLLTVLPQNNNQNHWATGARTPQGLVAINNTHFYLFFTGYTPTQGTRYESFGYAKVSIIGS